MALVRALGLATSLALAGVAAALPLSLASAQAQPIASPAATGSDTARFVVQVTAYRDQDAALIVRGWLKNRGWSARVSRGGGSGNDLYRVRVGGYANRESARKAGTALEAVLGNPVWVTTIDPAEPMELAEDPVIAVAEPMELAEDPIIRVADPITVADTAEATDSSRATPDQVDMLTTTGRVGALTAAQGEAESTESVALWDRLGEALDFLRTLDETSVSSGGVRSSECRLPLAAAAEAQSFGEQAAALARNPGLDLEAGLRTDFGGDEQIEDGLPGAYLGLSMEFLQSGLFENRKLGEIFRLRAEAGEVRATLDGIARANRCNVRAGDAGLAPLTHTLLVGKSVVMGELADAYRHAYLSGAVYLDEVLESEQEVTRTRAELAALPLNATAVPDLEPVGFPPAVELDLEDVLQRIRADMNAERLAVLRERESRLIRDADDETRLRLFLRYGFRPDATSQDRVSAGLIFRRPLFQPKDAGLDAEIEAQRRRANADREDRLDATREAYDRFRDQLDRVVRQHYLYLENFERVRRSNAGWSVDPDASDLGIALGRLTGLYNSALDRAAALRELYRAGAQVFVTAELAFDPTLFRPVSLPGPDYRGREGNRALYVWSDAFNRLDNSYLMELLRAKGFQRVVLSAGRAVESAKLTDFLSAAEHGGLEVEHALSTNAWLDPQRREGVTERVAGLELVGGGLHLDIEPQALDAFDENPDALLEAYLDVVSRARVAAGPSVPLSISVPIWWPADTYRQLDQTVDRFYLMAYGRADAASLVERLRRSVGDIAPEKLVLVLRPSDFGSEWAMDSVYRAISEAMGIRDGAVHDLAGYLTLVESQR